MHRITLGDFKLTAVSDGTYLLDGGAFFGVIPKVMWSRKMASDEKNAVTSGLNSLVVRTGEKTILIETGIGNKLPDRMVKFYGQPAKLLENLSAVGIAPEDIDIVINSHLHFDHCGWNTVRDKNGKIVPTFPRAQYYAPEGEWEYAQHPSERDWISFLPDNYDPLVESGRMKLLKGGEEIVPGVSVETFPGHTQWMQAIIVRPPSGAKAPHNAGPDGTAKAVPLHEPDASGAPASHKARASEAAPSHEPGASGGAAIAFDSRDEVPTACYISDLMPTSAHVDLTWGMGFDLYPLQTIESKKRYYERALQEKWITVFTHDPKMPWARIERDDLGKMIAKEVR